MKQNISKIRYCWMLIGCMFCILQSFAEQGDTLRILRTTSTIYPKENQYIGTDTVRFWWNKYAFTSSYHLQIAFDDSFENIVVETDTYTNDTIIAGLPMCTQLFWRVRIEGCVYGNVCSFMHFSPRCVSDMIVWYSADSVHTTANGRIDTLYDKSGNKRHATQATDANRPTLVACDTMLGNQPSIFFDGNDYLAATFGKTFAQPNTVFSLWNPLKKDGWEPVCYDSNNNGSNRHAITIGDKNTNIYAFAGTSLVCEHNVIEKYFLLSIDFNKEKSSIYENSDNKKNGPIGSYPLSSLKIGSMYTTSSAYNMRRMYGYIPELIFYHQNMAEEDRLNVERYIYHKYMSPVNLGEDIIIDPIILKGGIQLKVPIIYDKYEWSTESTTQEIIVYSYGEYWVKVTDVFGNESVDTISVYPQRYYDLQEKEVVKQSYQICIGDSAKIQVDNIDSGVITWSDNTEGNTFTTSIQGEYTFFLKEANLPYFAIDFSVFVDSFQTQVYLGNDTALCQGDKIFINIDRDDVSYVWSTEETENYATIDEKGNYSVLAIDENGCEGRDTIYVDILGKLPKLSIKANNFCLGDSTQFVAEIELKDTSSIAEVRWNIWDDTMFVGDRVQYMYEDTGSYNVVLYVETVAGCLSETSHQIQIHDIPKVDFRPQLGCTNMPIAFEDLSEVSTSLTAWSWCFEEGETSTRQNPTYVFSNAGDYDVQLVAVSDYGCFDTITHTVTIKPAPKGEFLYTQSCQSEPIYVYDNTAIEDWNVVKEYAWKLNNKAVSDKNNFTLRIDAPGKYPLSLYMKLANGCEVEALDTITVYPKPIANFKDTLICALSEFELKDLSKVDNDEIVDWKWVIEGQELSGQQQQWMFEAGGVYNTVLRVTTANGCSSQVSKDIEVKDNAAVDFLVEYDIAQVGTNVILKGVVAADSVDTAIVYTWTFDNGDVREGQEINYDFGQAGLFDVTLQTLNEAGCIAQVSKNVQITRPDINLILKKVEPVEANNMLLVTVVVENEGNRDIQQLDFNVSTEVYNIQESWSGLLRSGEQLQYTLATKLKYPADKKFSYLCVEVECTNGKEEYLEDNRLCFSSEQGFSVLEPYPNPATDDVKFTIFLPFDSEVSCVVYNQYGVKKEICDFGVLASGYNQVGFSVKDWASGVYSCVMTMKGKEIRRRFIVY